MRKIGTALALCAFAQGCDATKSLLPAVEITGAIQVDGDMPSDFKFEIFAATDNLDAFDSDACDEVNVEGDCYGRVKLHQLGEPVEFEGVEMDGDKFTLKGVPADFAYILSITGKDDGFICTTDVLGFNEANKVVTSESVISFDGGKVTSFGLARDAVISCASVDAPIALPTEEEQIPAEEPSPDSPDSVDENNDIQEPPVVADWTSFTITDKGGGTVYADATDGSVPAGVACDNSFPSVFEIHGTITGGGDEAFIRVQYGTGAEAEYLTIAAPVVDGEVHQELTLTGGYAIVQLDTDGVLNGEGESYTVTFCEPQDEPVQGFMIQISWDKPDTDVDVHVYKEGEEVAWYNLNESWGMLDIDDIDGYGPETFTSTPGEFDDGRYDVRIHYYSDHGNGDTRVTARVVYVDPETGVVCDVTAEETIRDQRWWATGNFGPGVCPAGAGGN